MTTYFYAGFFGTIIFVAGFVLSMGLFFEGYQHDPILEWRWSLKNRQNDCLIVWRKIEMKDMGEITGIHSVGDEVLCIPNNSPAL